ncbi:hypothetical protein [Halorussus aquaticus]|uniref:Uncharacterized protein n=1 Tax=Halorussus aquaticus TaxID=2953748 RepID=A0ABD5Q6M7_9EURY|nr:hypothetical protein [Halorussus aquaticus]
MAKTDPETGQASNESLGVSIPDEHVGAFVAEVFEDVERKTTWDQIVSSLVAEEARDEWEALAPSEQVAAVLSTATDYDERATDRLAGIPTDRGRPTPEIREEFDEAMRCRGNADKFRDGVAAAYDEGVIDDDELVAAVEDGDFDTDLIAQREDELERVANAYDFEFRPYGGTLMHDEDGEDDEDDPMDDFEAW